MECQVCTFLNKFNSINLHQTSVDFFLWQIFELILVSRFNDCFRFRKSFLIQKNQLVSICLKMSLHSVPNWIKIYFKLFSSKVKVFLLFENLSFSGRAGADGIPGKDGRDGIPGINNKTCVNISNVNRSTAKQIEKNISMKCNSSNPIDRLHTSII